ncbi:MAG TPA: hypothetical protein VH914_11745 [Acidimicrobiia bacterium]|nr:hypothetical protein [Acidimicrobiia bacterium]
MSDLTRRFERLANRGSMRGGDDVLRAARRDADDGAVVHGLDRYALTVHEDGTETVEPIDLDTTFVSKRPRRRFGAVVAVGGVAASLVVGTLAIGSVVGSGSGSDSPAGAVRQLADAVSHEDPIAAAAVLAPDEVRSLSSTVSAAGRRAQTLELARSADAPLAGVDLSVDGLDLSTQSLGADYAKVTVAGGRFSAAAHTRELAPLLQKAMHDGPDHSTEADLATLEQSNDLPTFVMTVQRNGHWYVSAAYTLLEYARELNHLPAADFGSGLRDVGQLGADTPDGAVKDALRALAKGDWARLIALAPPDEIPVYDYRAALEQLGARSGDGGFSIDKLDATPVVDGSTAEVKLVASGHDGDGDTWSIDGGCLTLADPSGAGASDAVSPSTCDLDAESIIAFATPLDGEGVRVTALRKNGRWFVSGVGTLLDLLDHSIATVSQRSIYSLFDLPQLIPPDGTITLGRPVTVPRTNDGFRVYSYVGHAGEELVAAATPTANGATSEAQGGVLDSVRLFDADGHELGELGFGSTIRLPAGGTYTLALDGFVETRLTLYEASDAPSSALHPVEIVPSFPCATTATTNPGEHCATNIDPSGGSKSSSATTSTVPVSAP